MKKDTDLLDAVLDRQGKVCPNHENLVEVLKSLDRRLRRVEIVGIMVLVGTAGSLCRETLAALLLKLAGG